jgi:LmbE family N-acetylglucosaminyl deacetylase
VILTGCRRLVVSPHLDDGVLSCGGALAAWAAAGERPAVVTVCAGRPCQPLTDFARFQHARWGELDDLVGWRRAEDARALALLGATPGWLEVPDSIYRGERYTSEAAIFGEIAPDERALSERIADQLAALWQTTAGALLYLPLGLGGHVDHRLVVAAGQRLAAAGRPVVWYEDFPYAMRSGGRQQLAVLTAHRWPYRLPIEAVLERKIAAIAAYASQVPVLFGSTAAMPAAVRQYARASGGGQPAECLWMVGPGQSTL